MKLVSVKGKHSVSAKNRKKTGALLAAAGIVLALVLIGVVGARYLYKSESQGSIHAAEFYFTSDLLDGATHTLAPGTTEITFYLGNHADSLRYAETPIEYTVKVDGNAPTGAGLTGTLAAGSVQDQQVTITGLEPGKSYTVTAVGEGGYHKTLTAILEIPKAEQFLYKYLDTTNGEYVLLTVWAKGVEGDVTITSPHTVIPDNTDAVMRNARTGEPFTDSVSFKGTDYASHVYRFFGSGVTVDNFTVKCGETTATTNVPN